MTVRVPAKVNLQLAVGPARADGYHSLVTVFHAVSLFDEVTVAAADKTTIAVTGEDAAAVPADRANLAWQAASALAKATGQRGAAVRIEIRKRIPVAAGLAGGSADAAATLVACNELWQAGLSSRELAELAATLGSDVPFALVGGTAVGRGRGEQLTPALAAGTYHWALAFGHEGLSTAQVYATCDRLRAARAAAGDQPLPGEPELSHPLMTALRSGDPAARRAAADQRSPAGCAVAAASTAAGPGSRAGAWRARGDRVGIWTDLRVPGSRRRARPRARRRPHRVGCVPRGRAGQWPGTRCGRRAGPRPPAVMNLVNLEQAAKAYHERVLLDGVSLGVAAGQRIGVVGRNGAGKTTLLGALAGAADLDSGRATRAGDVTIGYLPQAEQLAGTVASVVFGDVAEHEWAADPRSRAVVEALLGDIDTSADVSRLSGGERRRTALAALLRGSYDLLLLDEPTNHLDIEAITWLAGYLRQYAASFVVVTHDRWFLDAVTDADLGGRRRTGARL